jgi:hypothetical protein
MFENRVLRRMFGPKRHEMGRACSTNGEKRNVGGRTRRKETIRKTKTKGVG